MTRQEQILEAAVRLFRQHGFHGAGIDQIGAEVGISGPAIYRHYPNKLALLIAASERAAEHLEAAAKHIVADADDAAEALRRLVDMHVRFALTDRELIAVYLEEERNIPTDERRRIRRLQRSYLEQWLGPLEELMPAASPEHQRAVLYAVYAILNSPTVFDSHLDSDELAQLLARMAMAAIRAG